MWRDCSFGVAILFERLFGGTIGQFLCKSNCYRLSWANWVWLFLDAVWWLIEIHLRQPRNLWAKGQHLALLDICPTWYLRRLQFKWCCTWGACLSTIKNHVFGQLEFLLIALNKPIEYCKATLWLCVVINRPNWKWESIIGLKQRSLLSSIALLRGLQNNNIVRHFICRMCFIANHSFPCSERSTWAYMPRI